MFRWRRAPDAPEELLWPSFAWFSIFKELLPGKYPDESATSVYNRYSLQPGGPTLGTVAEDHGIW
jgi:hypothetical protein